MVGHFLLFSVPPPRKKTLSHAQRAEGFARSRSEQSSLSHKRFHCKDACPADPPTTLIFVATNGQERNGQQELHWENDLEGEKSKKESVRKSFS